MKKDKTLVVQVTSEVVVTGNTDAALEKALEDLQRRGLFLGSSYGNHGRYDVPAPRKTTVRVVEEVET